MYTRPELRTAEKKGRDAGPPIGLIAAHAPSFPVHTTCNMSAGNTPYKCLGEKHAECSPRWRQYYAPVISFTLATMFSVLLLMTSSALHMPSFTREPDSLYHHQVILHAINLISEATCTSENSIIAKTQKTHDERDSSGRTQCSSAH